MRLFVWAISVGMVVAARAVVGEDSPPPRAPATAPAIWWSGTPEEQEEALRAIAQEKRRLLGHTAAVTSVAYSSNGTRAASASEDKTVRLWDIETGREVRQFEHPSDETVQRMVFSPDGSKVFACSDSKAISIWDTDTGKRVHKLEGHAAAITQLAVAPDGKSIVTTAADGEMRRWDPVTGEGNILLKADAKAAPFVSPFFADSELITLVKRNKCKIWDVQAWKQRGQDAHGSWAQEHGSFMAASAKPFLVCRKAKSFQLFRSHDHSPPPSFRWSDASEKVTTSLGEVFDTRYMIDDRFLRLYGGGASVETWRLADMPKQNQFPLESAGLFAVPVKGVRCATMAPSGREGLSGYDDGRIEVWKLPPPRVRPHELHADLIAVVSDDLAKKQFDLLDLRLDSFRGRRVYVPTSDDALALAYQALFSPRGQERTQAAWDAHFALLDEWAGAKPASVAPLIARAGSLVAYAWQARGSGFADTVTEEGGKIFGERLEEARDAIDRAIELDPSDPESYRLIVHVARGGPYSRKEVDKAVDRCRAIAPDYAPLYTSMAEYLLPRWYGEPGELEKWADTMTESGTPGGDSLYARIAIQVLCYERDGFGSVAETAYPRLKNGFDSLTKRFPESTWIANYRAYFACVHHDLPTAQEAFALMDKLQALHPDFIWAYQTTYEKYRRWANPKAIRGQERLLLWATDWGMAGLGLAQDGKQIVSIGKETRAPIRIWDRTTGKLAEWTSAGGVRIKAAAVSPDGTLVYVGGMHRATGQTLVLRVNLQGLAIDGVIPAPMAGEIQQLAVSSDGTLLAAGCGGKKVLVWNLEDGTEKLTIPHGHPVMRVRFSKDGKRLATQCGDQTSEAFVWDVETGERQAKFSVESPEGAIGFSPDGQCLAVCEDGGTLVVWDLATNQKKMTSKGGSVMTELAFSPDGSLLATNAYDRGPAVVVIDVATGKALKTLGGHFGHVMALLFSPDGTEVISAAHDGTVRVWDISAVAKKQASETVSNPAPLASPPKPGENAPGE